MVLSLSLQYLRLVFGSGFFVSEVISASVKVDNKHISSLVDIQAGGNCVCWRFFLFRTFYVGQRDRVLIVGRFRQTCGLQNDRHPIRFRTSQSTSRYCNISVDGRNISSQIMGLLQSMILLASTRFYCVFFL